ncbi:MAG: rhomboid family intramembrane serine protease [Polyangiaceae bacterium]|nr:rhomboid family intramembrane serine protease [Polyangiaceae bacterium]
MRGQPLQTLLTSTSLLVIASVVVVSVLAFASDGVRSALLLSPSRVRKGEVHRLLTAGWVHVDASHLFFNMLTLWFFADEVVKVIGDARFLLLYASAVVVAFIPTTLRHMDNRRYASVGASGAVAAVMFSAILLHPEMKLYLMFLPFKIPALFYALGYLAYSIWHSYRANDGVNHDAHFSGALYGCLLTWVFEPARVSRALGSLSRFWS